MSMTTTSTASVLQELGVDKVCLDATSNEDSDICARMVRFDSECVLIPDRGEIRRPKLNKVYSLPLWKRRTGVSPGREVEVEGGVSPTEERVLFKVPIPRFISKSPSRGRAPSSSPPLKPLSPILVHRLPSTLTGTDRPKPIRRSSLPVDHSHTHKLQHDEITIPLRECCVACEAVTESCIKEGDHWHEKFDRGARRRRSASLDNHNRPDITSTSSSSKCVFVGALSDVDTSNSRFNAPTFALTVDEVDKRRKSLDVAGSELTRHSSSTSNDSVSASTSSSSTAVGSPSAPSESPASIQAHRPKASPIEEEDEDQLFPLPSPRRSPASTPSASPRNSPLPSPNASSSYLGPHRASKESLLRTWTTADEDMIGRSLSRSPNLNLQPPPTPAGTLNKPSGLSLSIPREGSGSSMSSTNSSKSLDSPARLALAPLNVGTKPAAGDKTAKSSSPTKQKVPSPRSPTFDFGAASSPRTAKSRPVAIPETPKKERHDDISTSPSSSPVSRSVSKSPTHRRRPSLSIPGIGHAIKGAGLEVLKGVTSFGTGGGTMVG